MPGQLVLSGYLRGGGSGGGDDGLLGYLMEAVPDISVYKPNYMPGQVYNSLDTWVAVIAVAGSLCTIAEFLWSGYERVTSKQKDCADCTLRQMTAIRDEDGRPHRIFLDVKPGQKQEFIDSFVCLATEVIENQDEDVGLEYSESGRWRCVHRRGHSDL